MKLLCGKCNGTGTEVMPGKGARACSCRRDKRALRDGKLVDLQTYRTARAKHGSDQKELSAEDERVRREVDAVMTFFKGYAPDFITGAVVDAICEACSLTGIDEPTYENDHVDESETRTILARLFSKTEMLSLRDNRNVRA